jgi:hypothetical protein
MGRVGWIAIWADLAMVPALLLLLDEAVVTWGTEANERAIPENIDITSVSLLVMGNGCCC